MFEIGEKIFYPMHGAGVVEAVEEIEILGEKQLYYILNMNLRDLQVMIPMNKTANLDIREVVDSKVLEDVLDILHKGIPNPTTTIDGHVKRQRMNMDKMKSGDIYEGVQVICDLMCLNKGKKLGTTDKMMLDNARLMLISELAVVKGLDEKQAAGFLNKH